MHKTNQLPSFNATFSNLYSIPLGLGEQEQQLYASEQQATFSDTPVYNCDSGQSKIRKAPPSYEQHMRSKQLTDFIVSVPTVAHSLPESNHQQYTLTNDPFLYQPNTLSLASQRKFVDNGALLNDLDDEVLSVLNAIDQPPQQTNIFTGCPFNSRLPTASTVGSGSLHDLNVQSTNHAVYQKTQEPISTQWKEQSPNSTGMVIKESGIASSQYVAESESTISYSMPFEWVDEHFNRSLRKMENFKKRSNSDAIDIALSPNPTKMVNSEPLTINENHSEHSHLDLSPDTIKELINHSTMVLDKTNERRYMCVYKGCGKLYKKRSHISSHFFTHYPVSRYKCSYDKCGGRYFRNKSCLDRHFRSIHNKEDKPYVCRLCDRRFSRRDHLQTHLNRKFHQKKN